MTVTRATAAGPSCLHSFWMQDAIALESPLSVSPIYGTVSTDVCVVGGGYTGLWTAIAIKQRDPAASVTVLEASVCGAGASGMNGGFAMTWWPKFGTLKKLLGPHNAAQLAQMSGDAVTAIGKFCADNGIEAHFNPGGWLWTASNQAQLGAWDDTLASWTTAASPLTDGWRPRRRRACRGRPGT